MSNSEPAFDLICNALRTEIEKVAEQVNNLHHHNAFIQAYPVGENVGIDRAEMHENINLAHRHLEDASSRLERAVTAYSPPKKEGGN